MKIFITFLLICSLIYEGISLSDNTCYETILQQYKVNPAACSSNFVITPSTASYGIDEPVHITIRRTTPDKTFIGVHLLAQDDKSINVGRWETTDPSLKSGLCDSLMHNSNTEKTNVDAIWYPSSNLAGNIVIKAIIIENDNTIYVDCFNIVLTPRVLNGNTTHVISPTADVSVNVTWTFNSGINVTNVLMTVKKLQLGEWAAFGLNLNRTMEGTHVFMCKLLANNTVVLQRYINPHHHDDPKPIGSEDGGKMSPGQQLFKDGVVTCQFNLSNFTNTLMAAALGIPLLSQSEQYHPVFAIGKLDKNDKPKEHAEDSRIAEKPLVQLNQNEIILYKVVNDSSVTVPKDPQPTAPTVTTPVISPTADVSINVTWTFNTGVNVTNVLMTVKNLQTAQWAAFGLNLDQAMGGTHVFMCKLLANNAVVLQRYLNPYRHNEPKPIGSEDGGALSLGQQQFKDGVVTCQFNLSNFTNTLMAAPPAVPPLSQSQQYHPVFAAGQLDDDNVPNQHGNDSHTAQDGLVKLDQNEIILYKVTTIPSVTVPMDPPPNTTTTTTTSTSTITSTSTTTSTSTSSAANTTTTATTTVTTQSTTTTTISTTQSTTTATETVTGNATQGPSPTSDVTVNVTWTFNAGINVTNVLMTVNNLQTAQWAAFGLNLNQSMGGTHVFMCKLLFNATVVLERYLNPHHHDEPESVGLEDGGIVSLGQQQFKDGIVTCQFNLSNFNNTSVEPPPTVSPLRQSQKYHPVFAIGTLDKDNEPNKHAKDSRTAQDALVQLDKDDIVLYKVKAPAPDNESTRFLRAHGIIMIFTWILVVSTGILISRYFKNSWSNSLICGKAVWFAAHRFLMSAATILVVLGFLFILVFLEGTWVDKGPTRPYAHAITGVLAISFAFIQPFIALFRCEPNSQYRIVFNFLHAFIGLSAFILSMAALFLATYFRVFTGTKARTLMALWVVWIALVVGVLEFLSYRSRKRNGNGSYSNIGASGTNLETVENPKISQGTLNSLENYQEGASGQKGKTIVLVVHILVAAIFSIVFTTFIN